ncbi:unnamed protein product [Polarella glacialis]|uniref:Uncharacterized protein n=1 Tax=Polarella glacialis TaxID=89957 RepID=A0A813I147_POLGL|nr:unnamed protein product [Polarella glacialis]
MDGSEGEGEGNSEEASQQQSFQEALELALPWRRDFSMTSLHVPRDKTCTLADTGSLANVCPLLLAGWEAQEGLSAPLGASGASGPGGLGALLPRELGWEVGPGPPSPGRTAVDSIVPSVDNRTWSFLCMRWMGV